MKMLFLGIMSAMLFIGCTKDQTTTAFEPIVPAIPNDPNFRVATFSAQQNGNSINVSFSTSMENNISEVVLMHGSNTSQFCRVRSITNNGDAHLAGTYNVVDDQPQGAVTYYIIKYTTETGEWGCSDVYQSHAETK